MYNDNISINLIISFKNIKYLSIIKVKIKFI